MATDLALSRVTGDLIATPNNDIGVISGLAVTEQRIRTRLKIPHGDWEITLGFEEDDLALGSRLLEMSRVPMWRAVEEIPLVVKEALEPMEDIRVVEVIAQPREDYPTEVEFTVIYTIVEDDSESEELTLTMATVVGS